MTKLVRILGMLGSDHPGERASAALAAHRLIKSLNTTWWDLLNPKTVESSGNVIIRTVYEWGIDHAKAAESRIRQLKEENERLMRELKKLRN
ncbi:hypothetical protein AB4Y85_13485 [Microvirga sp. 2YAF29]|uniref:hypothetical protein n=1 Tax=Microvirga sp. 2YAF29 TaxID=3233031 RepID=UPI003F9A8B7E